MKPVVFLGPSLTWPEAASILDAEWLPPVQQGDLMRVLPFGPPAIGIVDGVFTDVPTVRHREILWVMSHGVPVFGAASMGALRAAELHGCGMTGVGKIFRWYRRYTMTPDDAVAVAHAPEELGSKAVSDALMDIRFSLRAARRAGLIDRDMETDLIHEATALPFQERRLADLVRWSGSGKLAGFVSNRHRSQKAEDACGMLRLMAEHARTGVWPAPDCAQPAVVHAWLDDLAASGNRLDGAEAYRSPK